MTGMFITFEGGDGSGKSTQIRLLDEWCRKAGYDTLLTREPGGTQLGASIRALLLHGEHVAPKAEALLYAADRAHHIETLVRPALSAGRIVLQDRYIDSSIAYQGAGRVLDPNDIERISQWATDELTPDLVVVLDLDPRISKQRLTTRDTAPDRLEAESLAFHDAVRQQFLERAQRNPERYIIIDATQTPEQISAHIQQHLQPMLAAASAKRAERGDSADRS